MDAFAAAGHRERGEPDAVEHLAHQVGELDTLREADALAWVEVEHEAIRVLWTAIGADAPLGHVELQGRLLGQPHQGGCVVDQRVGLGPIGVIDREGPHPFGG